MGPLCEKRKDGFVAGAVRLADHFWKRWVVEYLPTLAPRRLRGSIINVEIGDPVLVVTGTRLEEPGHGVS